MEQPTRGLQGPVCPCRLPKGNFSPFATFKQQGEKPNPTLNHNVAEAKHTVAFKSPLVLPALLV